MENSKRLRLFSRMYFIQWLFLTVLFSLVTMSGYAQSKTVTGKIIDSTGEPVIGASVLVKGTTNGVISDIDGNFSIQGVANDAILQISFVGYKAQDIPVAGKTKIDVTLVEDTEMLDEVVVVGYGVQKKSDVTGALASVSSEELNTKPVSNAFEALQGKAAGVDITSSQRPGELGDIRIRGNRSLNASNSPLYVVDGVQVGTDVSYLNPSDIESMEVLKDASATAIYGSAGANGVIMITTKQGSKGRTQLDISANWGIQQAANSLDVLDADGFSQALRIARSADGGTPSGKIFNAEYDGRRKSIDWQDEMSRIALTQQYNISASGGNENTQSLISVSYLDQDGVVVNSNYERITARANVTHKIKDFITMGGDVNYVHERSYGTDGMSVSTSGLTSTNLRYAAALVPTMDYIEVRI